MPRVTQERALQTRRDLLHHTVEALVERGYAGTTTSEVCRRAKVSRGTLLYHFPTRADLLAGALEQVLSDAVDQFMAAASVLDTPPPAQLIGLMWAAWQGPALTAWLELAVAARTDEDLREPMRVLMLRFEDRVREVFVQLYGEMPPELSEVPFLAFAVLNGLSVGRSYEDPHHANGVLDLFTSLAAGQLEVGSLWKN